MHRLDRRPGLFLFFRPLGLVGFAHGVARDVAALAHVVELDADLARHARFLHRDAVQNVADAHRALVVRDDDELRLVKEFAHEVREAVDVRLVERRIDLVEDAERARPRAEDRQQQRHGRQRLLTARQKADALKLLAGRTGDDLDAGLQHILRVLEVHVGLAAAEELAIEFLEVDADRLERFHEAVAALAVDALDEAVQGLAGPHQVLVLLLEELGPLLKGLLLVDRFEVHGAQSLDLALEFADLLGHRLPVHRLGLPLGVALGQVQAEIVADALKEIVAFGFDLALLELAGVNLLLELVDLGLKAPRLF